MVGALPSARNFSEPRAMRALSFMRFSPGFFWQLCRDMPALHYNPRPIVRIRKEASPSSRVTLTETRVALACLTTLVNDSWRMR